MKKALLLLSVILIIGIAAILAHDTYVRKVTEKVSADAYKYWTAAIQDARDRNLMPLDFMAAHEHRAIVMSQSEGGVVLRETKALDSFLCDSWSIDISYSYSGGESARFTLLTGSSDCI